MMHFLCKIENIMRADAGGTNFSLPVALEKE